MMRIFISAFGVIASFSTAAAHAETIAYRYDSQGRLIMVSRSSAAGTAVTTYTFDRAHNRTFKTVAPS